jgi:cytochrome c peroxidase
MTQLYTEGSTRMQRATLATIAAILTSLASATHVSAQSPRIPPADVTRPANTKPLAANPAELLKIGTIRHDDVTLSPAGRSCNTCHKEANSYNPTFNKPWPHPVESVKTKTGLDRITAEGMVQFCMISAMGTRPLAWDSEALAALTAFVLERHAKVVKP